MATLRQKKAFRIMTERISSKENKPMSMGAVMREAGYGECVVTHPAKVTRSLGWKEMMARVDDNEVLNRVMEIATDVSDKRACLAAADMIFKLKDRYPAGKLKVTQYEEELKQFDEGRVIAEDNKFLPA